MAGQRSLDGRAIGARGCRGRQLVRYGFQKAKVIGVALGAVCPELSACFIADESRLQH